MPHVTDALSVRIAERNDLAAWQRFVDRSPGAGCMHHAAWYEVLRDAYWVTPYFLVARDGDGEVAGILPLYYSRSLLTGPHLSSLEDGALAARDDAVAALLVKARQLRDETGARYLQVRGGPVDEPAAVSVPTVRTFVATRGPGEALWSGIKKKTRWAIRQAQQQAILIGHDAKLESLGEFYRVYAAHMHELGTPVMGADAFRALEERLGRERLRLYTVRYGNRLIGGMLCILNGVRWTDYYAIVRPAREIEFANYLLYWHVIQDAAAHGAAGLDLGRSTPGSNVHLFKRKWGGVDVDVPYHFYPRPGVGADKLGLEAMKKGKGLPQRIWSRLPLAVCNRLGPLLRKQLPFI
jgi:hypothetical protein